MKLPTISAASAGATRALIVRAASIAASFLLTVLVARLLSIEDAGAFFLIFTSLTIAATFARFGTDNLALKQCGGDTENLQSELRHSATLVLGAGILSALALWGIAGLVGSAELGVEEPAALLVASAVIPLSLGVLGGAILRGRGYLGLGVFAEVGSVPSLTAAALLGFGFFGTLNLGIALSTYALAAWATLLWVVPAAVRSLIADAPSGERGPTIGLIQYLRQRISTLSAMMGSSFLFYVLTWMPVFALTFTSSLAEVSYYNVAARLANLVALVPILQIGYLAPSFARLFQMSDISALNALASRSAKQASIVLVLPILVLVGGAHWVVTFLYGPEYAPAATPLAVLSASAFVVVVVGQVNQLMLVCDLERFALVLNVGLVLLWSTAGLLVASNFAADGAAWFMLGTTVVYSTASALRLRQARGIKSYVRFS